MAPVSYGPVDSDVVRVTTRRRVEDFHDDFDPISASKKAARISAYTNEDLDAMKSRSRRQDQALLNDINTKLGQADFTEPARSSRGGSALRRIVIIPTSSPTLRQHRQSTPPPARVVTVNANRGRRATSVPPIPTQTRVFEEEDFVFPRFRPSAAPRRRPAPSRYQHTTAYYSQPPPPAHFSGGYQFRSRRAGSEPPVHATCDLAVRNARRCLQRLETELGGFNEDAFTPVVLPARKHTYRAASVPRHVPSAPAGVAHQYHAVPRVVPAIRRGSVSYARPIHVTPSPTPRRRIFHDLEDAYTPSRPVNMPPSLHSIRHQAVEARNKMDQARTLYDRYLPAPTGYPEDVQAEVDFKFSELAARMPVLERRTRYGSEAGANYVPPYKPAPKPQVAGQPSYMTQGLRHPPPRPKVSEARKHAREVLCRTKRDPNYFNY